MTDVTPEPIVLISEQADTETVANLEAELAKAKASTLERRTLAQWLAYPRPPPVICHSCFRRNDSVFDFLRNHQYRQQPV